MKPKQQKGVMTGREAAAMAEKAHRKEALKKAKQGKGPVPEYREQKRRWFR